MLVIAMSLSSVVGFVTWLRVMGRVLYDAFMPMIGLEDDLAVTAVRWVHDRRGVIVPQLIMLTVALPLL